jgi:hypothetical protein
MQKKLLGIPNTSIILPNGGLAVLDRHGKVDLSDEAADYLQERISKGFLPEYSIDEYEPPADANSPSSEDAPATADETVAANPPSSEDAAVTGRKLKKTTSVDTQHA